MRAGPAQGHGRRGAATTASADVVRYADFLVGKHDDALQRVGGARKAYSYTFSFNGFAAELSAAQAGR
jgi:hypothetical protein